MWHTIYISNKKGTKMICFDCEELIEYGDLNFVDEGEYSQVAVDTKCWWNRLRKEGF
jgi:hypothetical protein